MDQQDYQYQQYMLQLQQHQHQQEQQQRLQQQQQKAEAMPSSREFTVVALGRSGEGTYFESNTEYSKRRRIWQEEALLPSNSVL